VSAKKDSLVVKVPDPVDDSKTLKVRVPIKKLSKKLEKLKNKKGKKLKKALKKLKKKMKKQVRKALKKKLKHKKHKKHKKHSKHKKHKKDKKHKKACALGPKGAKCRAARKAAKKLRKQKRKARRKVRRALRKKKKLSKKAKKNAKLNAAATKAATMNAALLKKYPNMRRKFMSVEVPDPKRPGQTKKVRVSVLVPAPKKPAVKKQVVIKTLRIPDFAHPGKFITKKIKVVQAFKTVRQAVPDPTRPGKTLMVNVPVQVKLPPKKPNEAMNHQEKVIQKHIHRLEKNIARLKPAIKLASRKRADSPILEDGAPAPPDRQQVEMAQNLYKSLARDLKSAGRIGQKYLEDAKDMIVVADANHEQVQDFNIKMNEQDLLPHHVQRLFG